MGSSVRACKLWTPWRDLTAFYLGLAALMLLRPCSVVAQVPYGTTLTGIAIEGAPESRLDAVGLEVSDVLTPEAVHAAIQALYDVGGYARIEVEATSEEGGTRLTFHVAAPYYFSTIRLEPERLLDRSLSSILRLPYGQRFSRIELDRIVDEVNALLRAEGYFQATLTPRLTFDDDSRLVTTTIDAQVGPQARIGRIVFTGTQETFSTGELVDALDLEPGQPFLETRVSRGIEAIETLFAERRFLDSEAVAEVLEFDPAENVVHLTIRIDPGLFLLVDAQGYELSDETLEELLPFYEERTVDVDLIEEGRLEIIEHLRREGFLEARVEAEFYEAPFDPAYQVNYIIDPGERYSIREVRLEGNRFFTDEFLLEQIGISSERLFTRGVYSPDLLAEAEETIRRLYEAAGFAGTRVTAEDRTEGDEIAVVLEVAEGRRLVVDRVAFEGATHFSADELAGWIDVRPGQPYAQTRVQAGRRELTGLYYARGFDQVRVESEIAEAGDNRVEVRYRIQEGEASRIRRILVAGNTRTQEKIVHRNSSLEEGDPFDPEAILEAERRLYATGLFNRVEIVPLNRAASEADLDLLIQLEDAGPVVLTYGVGAQDREGIRGTVEVTHSNLWGLDRSISFRVRGSKREQRFQSTYREPRLFNWELDGFASLFVERTRRQFFDASRVDFSLQSLKQFDETDSLLMSASYQTVNLRDIRVNPQLRRFPDSTGVIQIARLGAFYIRDTRNDQLNPRRGNYFTGSFQLANRAFGSEVNFTSFFTQASIYRPANQAVLAASLRFGWNQPYGVTESLPITERYFAGGSTTLRGFGLDDAGPDGGGNALTILNAEYRFPIPLWLSDLGGTVFYDTGNIFERISDFNFGNFTHSAGVGLRYQTPLGPVRLDFGFNLNPQPGDVPYKIFLTLGHPF